LGSMNLSLMPASPPTSSSMGWETIIPK
jgi:hypothetical protein